MLPAYFTAKDLIGFLNSPCPPLTVSRVSRDKADKGLSAFIRVQ